MQDHSYSLMIHSQAGEKEKAMESFQDALQINQELADKLGGGGAFFQLGAIAVQHGKMQERSRPHGSCFSRGIKSDDVKNVEPLVERLAAQLSYSQGHGAGGLEGYAKIGWGLVERAWEGQGLQEGIPLVLYRSHDASLNMLISKATANSSSTIICNLENLYILQVFVIELQRWASKKPCNRMPIPC